MFWPKLNQHKISQHVFAALGNNANYRTENILGLPATYLDDQIFYDDAPFLKDAPFLSAMIANPNHIGCHTLETDGEPMFKGTQDIERELIKICACEILGADKDQYDGYVASGGTEANIEAMWIYRNLFIAEYGADHDEIAIVCSEDTHYSIHKASNLLNIPVIVAEVDNEQRSILLPQLEKRLLDAKQKGIKYFIVVANMATTMFGSVDDPELFVVLFETLKLNFRLHVDGAYGGFIYPFTNPANKLSFRNPHIGSISLDAHKMLQAPYGTGIFLSRKNLMPYVQTNEASYVKGTDFTLCGSRSGANALCTWMILHSYGSSGWMVKMHDLNDKTAALCARLDELNVRYFRNPFINIISIKAHFITPTLAAKYFLIPDTHDKQPQWYKLILMPHVKQGVLDNFINELHHQLRIA